MKLMVMPKEPTWWIWFATASSLVAGLAGWPGGFTAGILLSATQTAIFALRNRSLMAFPVQIRGAYTLLLMMSALPPFGFMFWVPAVGTLALLLFGYCLMARVLSLMPWNRSQAVTLGLVWRTFMSPPVIGNIRQGLPAGSCPGGVCALERHAADLTVGG